MLPRRAGRRNGKAPLPPLLPRIRAGSVRSHLSRARKEAASRRPGDGGGLARHVADPFGLGFGGGTGFFGS